MRIPLALLFLALVSPYSSATIFTIYPDGSGDYTTIQDALDVAASNDTIRLADGTFTGVGNRELLISQPGLRFESQSGNPTASVLFSEWLSFGEVNEDVVFANVGFYSGARFTTSALGGIHFQNCRFTYCPDIADLNEVVMTDCYIVGCYETPAISGTRVELTDCLFESNSNDLVYGLWTYVTNCEFRNNAAEFVLIECYTDFYNLGHAEIHSCLFTGNTSPTCLYASNDNLGLEVRDCSFLENSGTGIWAWGSVSVYVYNSTFTGNGSIEGADIYLHLADAEVNRSIFSFRENGDVLHIEDAGYADFTNCDIFSNAGGDWVGDLADQYGVGCNMSENPQFCDMAAGDLTLYNTSPCLPENNDCEVQIGAKGQGCIDWTPIDQIPPGRSSLAAFPNPFNPSTRLSFLLPSRGSITLTIHDSSGRLLETLIDGGNWSAGQHYFDWNASGFASGVYLARLSHSNGQLTEKLILLR